METRFAHELLDVMNPSSRIHDCTVVPCAHSRRAAGMIAGSCKLAAQRFDVLAAHPFRRVGKAYRFDHVRKGPALGKAQRVLHTTGKTRTITFVFTEAVLHPWLRASICRCEREPAATVLVLQYRRDDELRRTTATPGKADLLNLQIIAFV